MKRGVTKLTKFSDRKFDKQQGKDAMRKAREKVQREREQREKERREYERELRRRRGID